MRYNMKTKFSVITFFTLLLLIHSAVLAQYPKRTDAIWARIVPPGTITLDGILDEPAWAKAESLQIVYGQNAGLPTSGWKAEFQGPAVTDPTHAVVKFLVQGNQLFLGFTIPDSSIGGISDWARWDAILMSVKDKSNSSRPSSPVEYFYTWQTVGLPNTNPVVGSKPRFAGTFGNFTDTTRTPEQRDAWDAYTVVHGISNDSLSNDTSWVVEMKVDLGVLGYDVTKPDGDVVALNFSIWDCDHLFEGNPSTLSTTRTAWQSAWGNVNQDNVGRVYARPDITINTATLPIPTPDVVVLNGASFPEPVIDGVLDDAVWGKLPYFEIAWNDSILRRTYPGIGPLSSGQFQPVLDGNPLAPVLDPSYAKIKMFFRDHYLYLAADVNDQIVQGVTSVPASSPDKLDGVSFIVGDRVAVNEEHVMLFRNLRVEFGPDGNPAADAYLPALIDSGGAQWALHLKPHTTVNINTDVDSGYTIEMKIDLNKLGYPAGLGDHLLFMGVDLFDGDSFDDPLNNYGTRTWWFREHEGGPACAWMVMDPNLLVNVDDNQKTVIPNSLILYGNYPNPFNPSTKIKYSIPFSGNVIIYLYNSLGQVISSVKTGSQSPGQHEYNFNAGKLASGVYFYKISLNSDNANRSYESRFGKMLLLK
jgi:Secretion system C-terminal sorting domain